MGWLSLIVVGLRSDGSNDSDDDSECAAVSRCSIRHKIGEINLDLVL
jgi:hypothetical protein